MVAQGYHQDACVEDGLQLTALPFGYFRVEKIRTQALGSNQCQ
jgi:hypothetical protein